MPKLPPENMSVNEAAERLGINYATVQMWLRQTDNQGRPVCPIGWAIPCRKSFRYVIPRGRFERYITGMDLSAKEAS